MDPFETRVRSILQSQARKVEALYAMLANNVSIMAVKYKPQATGNVWKGNAANKARLEATIKDFNRQLETLIRAESRIAWQIANRRADKLTDTYLKGLELPKSLNRQYYNHNEQALKSFHARRQAGMNLSDRVWRNGQGSRQIIEMYLADGLAKGLPAATVAKDVRGLLNEPNKSFRRVRDPKTGKLKLSKPAQAYHPGRGVYRSSYKNAMRLTRTETNMAFRHADFVRRQKLDFIIGYRVHLSPSHPKLDICDYMVGDYPKTFRFGGWHPHCLCYTTSIQMPKSKFKKFLGGEDPILKGEQRKLMPKTAELYVAKKSESINRLANKPYFINDNFEMKDGIYRIKKDAGWKRNLGAVSHPKKISHPIPVSTAYNMTQAQRAEAIQFIEEAGKAGEYRYAQDITRNWSKSAKFKEPLLDNYDKGNIATYSSGLIYDAMNMQLREYGYENMIKEFARAGTRDYHQVMSKYAQLLNQGLNKLPDAPGTYYRGIRDMPGKSFDRYIKAFNNKTVITEDYFMSTAATSDASFSGKYKFVIKGKSGKVIEHLSIHGKREREVLFAPGRKFKVTHIDDKGYEVNIVMEEI